MPKNGSNTEKTIKNRMRSMTGDFWTIDNISLYSNYCDIAIIPDGFILDEYRDHFEQYLEDIELKEEFHYSPTLFSEVFYGTPDLDFLVLYFAGISTLFEFNTKTIKFLPITALTDLNKLIVQNKNIVRDSKENPTEYQQFDELASSVSGYIDVGSRNIVSYNSRSAVTQAALDSIKSTTANSVLNGGSSSSSTLTPTRDKTDKTIVTIA